MKDEPKEDIPVLHSWILWYLFVIVFLAALILLFALFTNYFS